MHATSHRENGPSSRRECVIVANPAAGRLAVPGSISRRRLDRAAKALGCPVLGLDTESASEFRSCLGRATRRAATVVVAGGDGTFSDALNARLGKAALAFLPCGTGNALASALPTRPLSRSWLERVSRGMGTPVAVLRINDARNAFMASLGVDGLTVDIYRRLEALGGPAGSGFVGYARALVRALREYRPLDMRVHCRGHGGEREVAVKRCLAAMVSRHPYYGYGLKVNRGGLTDGMINLRCLRGGLRLPKALGAALVRKTPTGGLLMSGRRFTISCDVDMPLQFDGEWGGWGSSFTFETLPGHVTMIL